MSGRFTHMDDSGQARMVDVTDKEATRRRAVAGALVVLSPKTFRLLKEQALPKGEALNTARLAGIMAAKKTADLIPLCHPLPLSHLDVRFELDQEASTVSIEAEAATTGPTGVEMEALVAAQIAAATLYDMVKAVQKDVRITDVRLLSKSGGKSGDFTASE